MVTRAKGRAAETAAREFRPLGKSAAVSYAGAHLLRSSRRIASSVALPIRSFVDGCRNPAKSMMSSKIRFVFLDHNHEACGAAVDKVLLISFKLLPPLAGRDSEIRLQ